MEIAYLSTAYLAPVSYYVKMLSYNETYIEQFDHYVKQTYRNRCTIAGTNGEIALTIPTIKPSSSKCPMKDIRISDHGNWQHLHWNAIISAYNNSPFFEFYEYEFQPFYEKKFEFLIDFNEELRQLVCSLIDMAPHVKYTDTYKDSFAANEHDFREIIHPKKDFTLSDPTFTPTPYYQVFHHKNGFLPNLSIIDLLFNMGPESLIVLEKSIR